MAAEVAKSKVRFTYYSGEVANVNLLMKRWLEDV